ncbi:MAG: MalY/PatB family protein [Erysipelotrichaceae bacterium]
MYNFDNVVNRRNSNCVKWDKVNQDVIPLWIADMDFPCLPQISEAIINRANHPIYGYSFAAEKTYQLIVDWYLKHHHCSIKQEDIVLNTGVVYSLYQIVSLFVKEDEKIIIQPPVYPQFAQVGQQLNREVVLNPLLQTETGYQIDFDGFEKCLSEDDKIRLFILCNPHNPIGKCYSLAEINKLAEICFKHNVILLSDEIHSDIIMPNKQHFSALLVEPEYWGNIIVLSSATKTFNIAGLKMSFTIIRNPNMRQLFITHSDKSGLSSVNIFAIEAYNAAYTYGEQWSQEVNNYIYNNFLVMKHYLSEKMPLIKFDIPDATYMGWLDFTQLHIQGNLNQRLLNEASLFMSDGTGFYQQCSMYQRINVACPQEVLLQGLDRLYRWYQSL